MLNVFPKYEGQAKHLAKIPFDRVFQVQINQLQGSYTRDGVLCLTFGLQLDI